MHSHGWTTGSGQTCAANPSEPSTDLSTGREGVLLAHNDGAPFQGAAWSRTLTMCSRAAPYPPRLR